MEALYLASFKKLHDSVDRALNSPIENSPFHLNGDFDWYGNNPIVGEINDMIDSIIEMEAGRNG